MTSEKPLFELLDKAISIRRAGQNALAEKTFRKLVRKAGQRHGLHYRLGLRALQNGMREWAYAHFTQAVELAPTVSRYSIGLSNLFVRDGKHEQALAAIDKFLSNEENDPQALEHRGILLCQVGRLSDAVNAFNRALESEPDAASIHNNLGAALRGLGRFDDALAAFDRSLSINMEDADVHFNRGLVLRHLDRDAEALASFDRSLDLRPDHVEVLLQKGILLEDLNRLNDAAAVLQQARKLAPDYGWLALVEARLNNRLKADPQHVLATLASINLPGPLDAERHFEMGICYDRLQDSERAFEHFSMANRIQSVQPENKRFDKTAILARIRRLKEVFSPEWVADWSPGPETQQPAPVFMVGFPRSGTTLLDQILSGHPSIGVIEEQPILEQVLDKLERLGRTDPATWASLPTDQIVDLRHEYLSARARYADGGEADTLWVDKMPLRSVEIGLVHRLFPESCILFVVRHPCDVVLSCVMQNFELNDAMVNFWSLEDAAGLYDEVMVLWTQYEAVLPLRVHYVRYEDVVDDKEKQAREVLSFLGLEWHDSVLAHTETAKAKRIQTPSYRQVTQPIYRHARFRWLRYRDKLQPAMARLAPHIERFGYLESE